MIDWLLKIQGKNNSQNMEKSELLELRKEVAKLKRKVSNNILIHNNLFLFIQNLVPKRQRTGNPLRIRR